MSMNFFHFQVGIKRPNAKRFCRKERVAVVCKTQKQPLPQNLGINSKSKTGRCPAKKGFIRFCPLLKGLQPKWQVLALPKPAIKKAHKQQGA